MIHRTSVALILLVGVSSYSPAQVSPVSPQAAAASADSAPDNEAKTYTVPAGTRVLLSLKSEVSTRVAMPGDPVYLVSDFPVVEDGAVVLPAGMYVKGVIDSVQRPGKVKGRAQLQMHFVTMIFPNGVEVAIPGSLDKAPASGGAKVINDEGTLKEDGSKGRDTKQVATTTLAGAGVGGLVGSGAGSAGMGAGIGAGAGAAVGVLSTLFTRGNDIVFPQGTTLEMVLSRPLILQQAQLAGMAAYTGMSSPSPSAQR
jgi:type IV secretion system protein VirB10